MGQYHLVVNLDKQECVHPHKLGCGLKLWEQMANHPGTGVALLILLAVSNGRGGGDISGPSSVIGRWGGDRIAVIGDYAEAGDVPQGCSIQWDDYTDITHLVTPIIEQELEGVYSGEGWRTWTPNP